MIKHYQEMQTRVLEDENALVVLKIVKKAKLFNVALLQNEGVTKMLLEAPCKGEIPPKLLGAMGEIFNWIGEVERKAQMS